MRRLMAPFLASLGLCSLAFGVSGALAAAPTVSRRRSPASPTSATLEADVNPQGKATPYHFEYGVATAHPIRIPVRRFPRKTVVIPAGTPRPGQHRSHWPQPRRTVYHFRAVAKNIEGEIKSPDRTFMTLSAPAVLRSPAPTTSCASKTLLRAGSSIRAPTCPTAAPMNRPRQSTRAPAILRARHPSSGRTARRRDQLPQRLWHARRSKAPRISRHTWQVGLGTGRARACYLRLTPAKSRSARLERDFSHVYTKATQLGAPLANHLHGRDPGRRASTVAPYTNQSTRFRRLSDGAPRFSSNPGRRSPASPARSRQAQPLSLG